MIKPCMIVVILLTIVFFDTVKSQTGTEDGVSCDISCETCTFGQDPMSCLSCPAGSNRQIQTVNGQNISCECSLGYYDNG